MCDELVSMIEHMFTEEEAEVAHCLKPWRPMTAKKLATAAGRPLQEVEAMLDVLAHEKHVLFSFGGGDKERIFKERYLILHNSSSRRPPLY